MFEKKWTPDEMNERSGLIWKELEKQCQELQSKEFEFYREIWGVWWMPWFIEVNKQSLKFTLNDISNADLKYLVEKDLIEIVEIYDQSEMTDGYDRIRYRIKNTANTSSSCT